MQWCFFRAKFNGIQIMEIFDWSSDRFVSITGWIKFLKRYAGHTQAQWNLNIQTTDNKNTNPISISMLVLVSSPFFHFFFVFYSFWQPSGQALQYTIISNNFYCVWRLAFSIWCLPFRIFIISKLNLKKKKQKIELKMNVDIEREIVCQFDKRNVFFSLFSDSVNQESIVTMIVI